MIVLDTSFLVAFHNTRDAHHDAASGVMRRLIDQEFGTSLLPEYVFLELTTVLAARADHTLAALVGDRLLAARDVEFVPSSAHFGDTWDVFRSQGAAGLSFADAAIVALCRRRGVRWVATFDQGLGAIDGIEAVPGWQR